jgi:hypothetical protein
VGHQGGAALASRRRGSCIAYSGRSGAVSRGRLGVTLRFGSSALDRLLIVLSLILAITDRVILQPMYLLVLTLVVMYGTNTKHVIEELPDLARQLRHLHQLAPVEQQVVIIKHVLVLLGLRKSRTDRAAGPSTPRTHGYCLSSTASKVSPALTARE